MNRLTYIVGKRIKQQFNNTSVAGLVTFDEFVDMIYNSTDNLNNTELRIGQGLSQADIDEIFKLGKSYFKNQFNYTFTIDKFITHKQQMHNVMISTPEQISDSLFSSYLCIDENCDEMKDHLTGYHLQGIVLIEVARQMINAVSEKFFIDHNNTYSL